MLPRHPYQLDRSPTPTRASSFAAGAGVDVDDHFVEEVKVLDVGEGLAVALAGEMLLGVGRCNNWEGAAEGGFDVLVEVVGVVVGEKDSVDAGEVVEVNCWVCFACSLDAGAEMDVVACVEEVLLGSDSVSSS